MLILPQILNSPFYSSLNNNFPRQFYLFLHSAVARIALVKPEKARAIEDMIINAARRGALGEKVSEDRLIDLLEQVNEKTAAKTKVTIQRRRGAFDDDF